MPRIYIVDNRIQEVSSFVTILTHAKAAVDS